MIERLIQHLFINLFHILTEQTDGMQPSRRWSVLRDTGSMIIKNHPTSVVSICCMNATDTGIV